MNQLTKTVLVAAATLTLIAGLLVGGVFIAPPQLDSPAQASSLPQGAPEGDLMAAFEQAMVGVYQNTLPSVVNIRVTKSVSLEGFDFDEENVPEDHPEFFNQGGGSGFLWDDQGHIVTNNHVVDSATNIEVIFANDTTVQAEIVGTDPDSDLAVIKVDLPASALQPIRLGDSDNMQVGQLAIAIGNPFGQEFTMTSGIVSGVGRLIRGGNTGFSIPKVIQTDAPINPGNSGGPLLNRQGEVIGINTQMLSRSGSSAGIGFAVPINIAKRVVPSLINGDEVEYSWLGITGRTANVEILSAKALPATTRGAVVLEVAADGPADEAGVAGGSVTEGGLELGGDIIVAIESTPVRDMDDLITYLVAETQPGDTVSLSVIRADGSEEMLSVTLGQRPD